MRSPAEITHWTKHWRLAALTLLVFLVGVHLIPELADLVAPGLDGYGRAAVMKTMQLALVLLAIVLVRRKDGSGALAELGLRAPIGRAFVVAFAATSPMLVIFAATGALRVEYSLVVFAVTAVFSPIVEEVLFRGYAFGQLYHRANWSFWAAILVPTVFFSLSHLYQADSLLSAAGILGITAIGSVWFAWLYMRWDNLWVPIGMHALMNLWWYLFEVDTTALGGWLANGARLLTIVLSIVITIWHGRLVRAESRLPRLNELAR